MTEEEKELLFKYLCMALPYGVKVQHQHENYLDEIQTVEHISRQYGEIETESVLGFVDDFKPYLRPMSSMNLDECCELEHVEEAYDTHYDSILAQINWLLKNHFDFMGLILKGLAIETSEGVYKKGE